MESAMNAMQIEMGGLMAVATTSLLTLGHCDMSRKSHIINDGETRREPKGDNSSD